MLYQLSYVGLGPSRLTRPTPNHDVQRLTRSARSRVERETGFEPATPSLEGSCSSQLSYSRPRVPRPSVSICFDPGRTRGGEGRIRTSEGESQQIYSLPRLAASVPLRILATRRSGPRPQRSVCKTGKSVSSPAPRVPTVSTMCPMTAGLLKFLALVWLGPTRWRVGPCRTLDPLDSRASRRPYSRSWRGDSNP